MYAFESPFDAVSVCTSPLSLPSWLHFVRFSASDWVSWVLACRDAVVVVRGLCEEVTVVAHSTGAPVAALVAEMLPVDRLIFTGPNFVSQVSDRW